MLAAQTPTDIKPIPRARATFPKLIAFGALLFLMFYPSSPVFYISGTLTYILSWMTFVIVSLLFIPLRINHNAVTNPLNFLILYSALHAYMVGPLTHDLRMLATGTACVILTLFHHEDIRLFIWWLIKFFVAIFFIGAFVKIMTVVGTIDLNEWNVTSLSYLSESNPAMTRQNDFFGDALYYMPLYVTSLQIPPYVNQELFGFGPFVWYRFSFIFAEPTQLMMFITPLIVALFSLHEKPVILRGAFFIIFSMMMLWSFSIIALIVVFIVIMPAVLLNYYIISRNIKNFRPIYYAYIILFAFSSVLILFNIGIIDIVFNVNKASQLSYFITRSILPTSVTLFGLNTGGELYSGALYGWSNVIYKFGLIGAFISIYYYAYCFRSSIRDMKSIIEPALILSLLMIMIKYPEFINIYFTLIASFSVSHQKSRHLKYSSNSRP